MQDFFLAMMTRVLDFAIAHAFSVVVEDKLDDEFPTVDKANKQPGDAKKKNNRGANFKKGASDYAARWRSEFGGEGGQCSAPPPQDASGAAGCEASTSLSVAEGVGVVYPMGPAEELGAQYIVGGATDGVSNVGQAPVSLQPLVMREMLLFRPILGRHSTM